MFNRSIFLLLPEVRPILPVLLYIRPGPHGELLGFAATDILQADTLPNVRAIARTKQKKIIIIIIIILFI